MTFDNIIGQKYVVESLKNSIRNNMVSHAYIFEGPRGIGKKTIASIFASSLVCVTQHHDKQKVGEPCMECKSCIKSQSGNHPDIKIIENLNSSGGSIGVDIIREFQKDIYIKPYEANKKVYIFPEVERMTVQAQNSLLKTLEEPPAYGVIILTVQNTAQLLDTILSRAVLVRFSIHSQHEIQQFLSSKYPHLKDEIAVLAAFSGGVIGKAEELTVSEEFRNMRRKVVELIMTLLNDNEMKTIEMVSYFVEHKHLNDIIMDFLISLFRDMVFIKEFHNENKVINIDMITSLKEFAQKVRSYTMINIIGIIMDIKAKITMNANYALAIETMLMRSWEEIHGRSSRSAI